MIAFDPFDPAPLETQDWSRVDQRLRLPDNARLMRIAKAIDETHKGQADGTAGWRTSKNRYVGLFGERAFGRIFELPMDLRLLRFGNRRRNFTLRDGTVVDVVTRTWESGYSGGPMPELTIRHKERPSKKVLMLVYYQGEQLEPLIRGYISDKEAFDIGRVEEFREGIENIVVSPADLHHPIDMLRQHNPASQWITAYEHHQAEVKAAWTPEPEPEPAPTQSRLL
jgi:hypothetical protein